MTENRKDTGDTWIDPDDAPELTDEWFAKATLKQGQTIIRRGRPAGTATKRPITLRIDADVIEAYKATGSGWQTRMNDALRKAISGS